MRVSDKLPIACLALVFCAWIAAAHPMGNFSVNHFARFMPEPGGVKIRYVLDLAEIPTFELIQDWGAGANPRQKALEQARQWAANLIVKAAGKPVAVRVESAAITMSDGAANMPV